MRFAPSRQSGYGRPRGTSEVGGRMGRGRRSVLDDLAVLPWPVGLAVGALGFLSIRYGLPAWFSRQDGPFAQAFAQSNPVAPLAWIVLAAWAIASLVSFLNARRRRRLLDTRTGLDSVAALGWRDFERLVGEAFRRDGYTVEETGLGGADGGIDLVLRKGGRRVLVQCKQWKRDKVPVNVVREMYGLLVAHHADEVRIATVGGFTPDAARFAEGKPISLIDGETLLGMICSAQAAVAASPQRAESAAQVASATTSSAPECPRCGTQMVERKNRQTGSVFWGCPMYPKCRGTIEWK